MKIMLLTLSLSILFTTNAYAYLDPGTGSMLLQSLLVGLLVIGACWRNLKAYIKGFFSNEENDKKGNK